MKDDPTTVLNFVHQAQVGDPEKFFPPADTSDHRVLARSVLFVHGINSNASPWGVGFADRTCGQQNGLLHGWSETIQSGMVPVAQPGKAWGVAQVDVATIHATEDMTCQSDGRLVTDSGPIALSPVHRTWAPTQPWLDLTIDRVQYEGGSPIRQSIGYSAAQGAVKVVPWDLFRKNIYRYPLPNTYSDVLMRSYKFSTAPDILARIERLDRSYDSSNAQAGINRNGLYFYTALTDAGDSLSEIQPPMWNPALYGYSATKGQALQLWWRMDSVLLHHYGGRSAWIHDSTKKIDIVCHSQGCLITREALRNARDTSFANPLNHIRKVVSLNSPAFGSAMATQASDLSSNYSSIGQIRHLLLDTNGQLIPKKDVKLGILRIGLPLAGGVGGVVEGYKTCSDAVGVPVASQIAGVDCAELGYLGGWIAGLGAAFTDASWSLNGGLVGPYDLRVRTNTLGFTTINHLAFSGPTSMRKQVVAFADTTRHLSQTSDWINDLRNFRYPTRPSDAAPVPFSVRYSPTTQHIVDTLGIQVAADVQKYFNEHDDWYSENCDYVRDLFTAVLGTNSITDDATVNQLLQLTHDLQTQWTDQGDVVVEKGSQLMANANFGFDPGQSKCAFPARDHCSP